MKRYRLLYYSGLLRIMRALGYSTGKQLKHSNALLRSFLPGDVVARNE